MAQVTAPKRPRDPNQLAKFIVDVATENVETGHAPAKAVSFAPHKSKVELIDRKPKLAHNQEKKIKA